MAVDEEIGEDATGTPGDAIGPPLNARGGLFVDKDVTAHDELIALSVVRTTETMSEVAVEARLENNQRVLGGLDMAPPRGHTGRGLPHTHFAALSLSGVLNEFEAEPEVKAAKKSWIYLWIKSDGGASDGQRCGARSQGNGMNGSTGKKDCTLQLWKIKF